MNEYLKVGDLAFVINSRLAPDPPPFEGRLIRVIEVLGERNIRGYITGWNGPPGYTYRCVKDDEPPAMAKVYHELELVKSCTRPRRGSLC